MCCDCCKTGVQNAIGKPLRLLQNWCKERHQKAITWVIWATLAATQNWCIKCYQKATTRATPAAKTVWTTVRSYETPPACQVASAVHTAEDTPPRQTCGLIPPSLPLPRPLFSFFGWPHPHRLPPALSPQPETTAPSCSAVRQRHKKLLLGQGQGRRQEESAPASARADRSKRMPTVGTAGSEALVVRWRALLNFSLRSGTNTGLIYE